MGLWIFSEFRRTLLLRLVLWRVGLINIPCAAWFTGAASPCRRRVRQTEQVDGFTPHFILCFYLECCHTPSKRGLLPWHLAAGSDDVNSAWSMVPPHPSPSWSPLLCPLQLDTGIFLPTGRRVLGHAAMFVVCLSPRIQPRAVACSLSCFQFLWF